MKLEEQWRDVSASLPRGWERARLALTVEDEAEAEQTALILGPAAPGRSGSTFLIELHGGPQRVGARPELVRRVLERLDREGVDGRIELRSAEVAAEDAAAAVGGAGLASSWDLLLESLPPDWSHLYAEVELDSSDFVERGALLLAPVNPALFGGRRGLRFRCARVVGYGVAPEMARRCLERLDEERITGSVRILRVVSESRPFATQGPVWYIGGRAV